MGSTPRQSIADRGSPAPAQGNEEAGRAQQLAALVIDAFSEPTNYWQVERSDARVSVAPPRKKHVQQLSTAADHDF